jgi:hypothetical protein
MGSGVRTLSFLASILDALQWWALRPGRFNTGESLPAYQPIALQGNERNLDWISLEGSSTAARAALSSATEPLLRSEDDSVQRIWFWNKLRISTRFGTSVLRKLHIMCKEVCILSHSYVRLIFWDCTFVCECNTPPFRMGDIYDQSENSWGEW